MIREGEIIRENLQMTEEQIRTKIVQFIKGTETVNLVMPRSSFQGEEVWEDQKGLSPISGTGRGFWQRP